LICRNRASAPFERGCQAPISFSTLVLDTGGVGVGGTGVGVGGMGVEVAGTGVAVGGTGIGVGGAGVVAGALHPAKSKRTSVIPTNGCDNLW